MFQIYYKVILLFVLYLIYKVNHVGALFYEHLIVSF